MRYLIFGSNKKSNFIAKEKDNLNTRLYDIEETWGYFCDMVINKRYRYLYLIADFGIYNSRRFEVVDGDNSNGYYNFLTIAFCDTSLPYNMDNMILKNNIILQLKGFKHTFKDNLAAIEKFQYYVESKLKCGMFIDKGSIAVDEHNKRSHVEELVITSESVINYGGKHIFRYSLKEPIKIEVE